MYALTRDRLLYDSQFVAPQRHPALQQTVLYALLKGSVVFREPEERFEGPCVLRTSPGLLDGTNGQRLRSFCNYGTPLELVVLWAPNTLAVTPGAESKVERVRESEGMLSAFTAYHRGTIDRETLHTLRIRAGATVDACIQAGELRPRASDAFDQRWGVFVERTFEALSKAWSTTGRMPSLSDLSSIIGLSGRQLTRDIKALAGAISAPDARWRSTMLDWRIRQATTLLSAPTATVTNVAKEVGYGSVEAMGRAFRDANLQPPVEVRAAMLDTIASLEKAAPSLQG